jgi:hypothetical protein
MIEELGMVALVQDAPDHGLKKGDVGTVVHLYPSGDHCEVEFFTIGGRTLDVVQLDVDLLRPVSPGEVMQARPATPS